MPDVQQFRMCKYCGGRIVKPWGRKCRPHPSGDYCSKDCAQACHGFDLRIAAERNNGTVSFDPSRHDRACHRTPHPWELIDPPEIKEQPQSAGYDVRTSALERALSAVLAATEIDPRLPGMLVMISRGKTHEQIARKFKVSRQLVQFLAGKARAIVTE